MEKEIALDSTNMKNYLFILLFILSEAIKSATLNVPSTYPTIQSALNAANVGDVVLVQAGTYYENITWPTTQGITLKSASGAAVTIIDGGGTNRVITFPTGQNYTNSTIIDGFTIQNGYLSSVGWVFGAGIYAKDCSVKLKNITFKDNLIGGSTSSGVGAAIYANNSPNLIIDSCIFIDNELRASSFLYGGVIYCENNTNATITNSSFKNNRVTRIGTSGPRCYGGVIYANDGCDLNISNVGIDSTYIEVNSYIYGGAIYLYNNETNLTNVNIGTTSTAANSGRVYGGGIYYVDGDLSGANPSWSNVVVSGQEILATSYILGGALYLENTSIAINNAFFTRSVCNNSGGRVYGGGVYVSGGVVDFSRVYMTCNQTIVSTSSYNYGAGFYINGANVTLTNALIAHNEATNANTVVSRTAGLGIYMGYSGTLTATNITVTENTRTGSIASYGTGLANFGGTVNLVNSILWNNDIGNEIDGSGTNNITYSDIRNGYAGTGNINVFPQFVTPGSDYHLQSSSPCVNSGTNSGAPIVDLDGNARPVGGVCDMGAFEQQPYINTDFCPIVTLPLPITLLNFNAICGENSTTLEWSTASETNNDYFTIEKSIDGEVFYEVATIKGAGNSSSILKYSINDIETIPGITYYRLKQTDFDGKFSYSKIIAAKCNFKSAFNLYPNPVKDIITINIENKESGSLKCIITNSLGQAVLVEEIHDSKSMINVERLAKGFYQLQLIDNNSSIKVKKFIKQ